MFGIFDFMVNEEIVGCNYKLLIDRLMGSWMENLLFVGKTP